MVRTTKSGVFISIEGIEGVGKSTAVKFIEEYLKGQALPYVVTREPGGTVIAEQIRNVLLTPNPKETMLPETELLLMFASRVQHMADVISPALDEGKWVICDRFDDSSFAYQGGGRQMDLSYIQRLDDWLINRHPDVTILLDASPQMGLMRAKCRGPHDRIEQEKTEFFDRVRAVYLDRAKHYPERFRVIDASQSIDKVQQEIKLVLDDLIAYRETIT